MNSDDFSLNSEKSVDVLTLESLCKSQEAMDKLCVYLRKHNEKLRDVISEMRAEKQVEGDCLALL